MKRQIDTTRTMISIFQLNKHRKKSDKETTSEHFEAHDVKYAYFKRREAWYHDYENPDYIEMVRDHDDFIAGQN